MEHKLNSSGHLFIPYIPCSKPAPFTVQCMCFSKDSKF